MNKTVSALLGAALLATGAFAASNDQSANSARVDVQFDHPENFTDLKDAYMPSDKGQQAYMEMFRDYIQERAARRLPEGQKLTITFTDIDMAGDFEPWRGPSAQDVRIVKSIYVPRLKFNYRITDAGGGVVKDGSANLTDLSFQQNLSNAIDTSDPLRYEKRLLDDWMRSELPAPSKKK